MQMMSGEGLSEKTGSAEGDESQGLLLGKLLCDTIAPTASSTLSTAIDYSQFMKHFTAR